MSEIVQAIATYGVFPVVLAAILVIIIVSFKNQQAINKKQQEDNAAKDKRLDEMFHKFLENMSKINKNTDPIHTPEEEENNRKVNLLVETQLSLIQSHTDANRVSCFLYHNGGKDITGRSFQKMSMTHEIVDYNTVPVMASFQNLPRMMFPILIKKLAEQGYYYVEDIETIHQEDPTTYQSFKTRGAKSLFVQAIRAENNNVLGFVVAEFITNSFKDVKQITDCMIKKTIRIGGVLEVENVNENLGGKHGTSV